MFKSTSNKNRLRAIYQSIGTREPFHWYEKGPADAPRILFVHGYMAHALAFRRLLEKFPDHRMILVDLPAHGRDLTYRDRFVKPSMASLQHWLTEFAELVGPIDHIVAHSLGGLAVHPIVDALSPQTVTFIDPGFRVPTTKADRLLVRRLPTNVAKVVLNRIGFRIFEKFQYHGMKMGNHELDSYLAPLRERDRLRFMLGLAENMFSIATVRNTVEPLNVPTLVVWGREDKVLPVADAPVVAQMLGAELAILERCGHSPPEDRPDEFAEIWHSFVAGQS